MGVEETLLEELVGIKEFQVKERGLPEEMIIKEIPLSQRKENRRDPNMFMYSKDLLVQRVKKVNLDKQEEMVEMGKISP